jgi:hypothetical protein
VQAGRPVTFSFSDVVYNGPLLIVEQESDFPACKDTGTCVENHTGCLWMVDDHVTAQGGGYAGSDSFTQCEMADTAVRLIGVFVGTSQPDLTVTLSFPDQGVTINLPARVGDGSNFGSFAYEYGGCILGPRYQVENPAVQQIPDSNGGWAVPTRVTLTITHPPHNGKQEPMLGRFEMRSSTSGGKADYCYGPLVNHTDAGASWQWAL